MKLTKEQIKKAIKEAIEELDYKQFHDPKGEEGVVGTMDTADYYGSMSDIDNLLDFLDKLSIKHVRSGKRKLAKAITKAADAIEDGNFPLADKILVYIFKTGGKNRAVYHAIAYVRDQMGK